MVFSPTGPSAPKRAATTSAMRTPNVTATAASGCVRRHSSGNTSATATTSATGRQITSSRRMPSRIAVATSTATSTQSRHTRAGGCGARGSAQIDRTALLTMPAA